MKSPVYSIVRKSLDATPRDPHRRQQLAPRKSYRVQSLRFVRAANLLPCRIYIRAFPPRIYRLQPPRCSCTVKSTGGACIGRSFFAALVKGGTKNVGKKHFYDPSPRYASSLTPDGPSLVPVKIWKRNSGSSESSQVRGDQIGEVSDVEGKFELKITSAIFGIFGKTRNSLNMHFRQAINAATRVCVSLHANESAPCVFWSRVSETPAGLEPVGSVNIHTRTAPRRRWKQRATESGSRYNTLAG